MIMERKDWGKSRYLHNVSLSLCLAYLWIALLVGHSYAGWLIYNKPEFEGRVVDAVTGGAIEGAVVMATYYERYYTPISSDTEEIKVKQTLTDKDGRFRFPAYTTVISPFRAVDSVAFTIFRSDYASVDRSYLENIFTGKPPEEEKAELPWRGEQGLIMRFSPGVVALPKLRTKDEMRTNALSVSTPFIHAEERNSLLHKTVDEARRRSTPLGLGPPIMRDQAGKVIRIPRGWQLYYKPAFEGKVADKKTGNPIKGAVVAAIYYARQDTPISKYIEPIEPVEVKQTLTDKDGRFQFPSHEVMIPPGYTVDQVEFSIFSSDYASLNRLSLENIFTGKQPDVGKGELYLKWNDELSINFAPGIVKLPKLRTIEEMRLNALSMSLLNIQSGSKFHEIVWGARIKLK